jgi:hypothetical protein
MKEQKRLAKAIDVATLIFLLISRRRQINLLVSYWFRIVTILVAIVARMAVPKMVKNGFYSHFSLCACFQFPFRI